MKEKFGPDNLSNLEKKECSECTDDRPYKKIEDISVLENMVKQRKTLLERTATGEFAKKMEKEIADLETEIEARKLKG